MSNGDFEFFESHYYDPFRRQVMLILAANGILVNNL